MKKRILILVMFIMLMNGKMVYAKIDEGVHMLNVGNGECTLINTSETKGLIGCGWSEYMEKIYSYLDREKISELDFVLLTNYEKDNAEDLIRMLNDFNVKSVYLPVYEDEKKDDFARQLKSNNKSFESVRSGWQYKNKDTQLQLIPLANDKKKGDKTILLYGTIDGLTYLLSGDLKKENQQLMLQYNLIPEADILKMRSYDGETTMEMLNKVKPKVAIISGDGLKNSRYSNGDNLRVNGCKIYSTYDNDDIIIKHGVKGSNIDVKTKVK